MLFQHMSLTEGTASLRDEAETESPPLATGRVHSDRPHRAGRTMPTLPARGACVALPGPLCSGPHIARAPSVADLTPLGPPSAADPIQVQGRGSG